MNKYTKAAEKYWNDNLPDDDIIQISGLPDYDGTYTVPNIYKYNLEDEIEISIALADCGDKILAKQNMEAVQD